MNGGSLTGLGPRPEDEAEKWISMFNREDRLPLASSSMPGFSNLSINSYELIFSKCNRRIDDIMPVDTAYKLIVYYVFAFKNTDELGGTMFFQMFDVRNFIGSNAELFYLNRNIEAFIEFFNERQQGHPNALDNGSHEDFLRSYISTIVELSPQLIIDDLIFDSLDLEKAERIAKNKPRSKSMTGQKSKKRTMLNIVDPLYLFECPEPTLKWLYFIISCKHLRRTVLRFIFDRVIYFDGGDDLCRFQILDEVIKAYSQMDKLIRNNVTKKHIKAASDVLLTSAKSSSVSSKLVQEMDIIREKIKTLHLEDVQDPAQHDVELSVPADPSDMHKLSEDIVEYIKSLEGNMNLVVNDARKRDSLAESYQYYIDSQNIHEDNVFVLGNLVWEEIIFYLLNFKKHGDGTVRVIIHVLMGIIRETGDFFRKRIVDNRVFLRHLDIDVCEFIDAVVCNFKSIDDIYDSLARLLAKCQHKEKLEHIKKKLAASNPVLFEKYFQNG